MESKAKIFGHPIHPILVVFPIGLFAMAVISDIVSLISPDRIFSAVAYYDISGGLIVGFLAALFGWYEWTHIPNDTRAKSVASIHGLGNLILIVLFLISWIIRRGETNFVPSTAALILSFLGIGLGLVTAWLGGELIYRLDIGVDTSANVDAPNSLTMPAPAGRMDMPVVPVTGRDTRTSRETREMRETPMPREPHSRRKE
jgi:uncharacterized membrane protein